MSVRTLSLGQKATKGISWLAIAQVAQRATTLVVTVILARQLFPVDFGLIALTLLTVNFISYFQDMGLSAALVQRAEVENDHLVSAFWINVVAGFALALIGAALAPAVALVFREGRITTLIIALMVTLPINGLGWVPHALLQRRLAFGQIAIIEWVSTFVSGGVAITLALSGAGVWSLVAQNFAGSIVSTSGRLICANWLPRLAFNYQRARELFSFSLGAFGSVILAHVLRNIDNLIVGTFLGVTSLGYYSLAYNLILMPGMTICGLVGRVMFPALSSVQNDLVRFRRAYLRMARAVACATLPLIVGLGATAPIFVSAIYGEKWAPIVPILRVLIVVGTFEATNIQSLAFWSLGNSKITIKLGLLSLVAMTVAFAVGLQWGLMGIAWAYVVVSPVIFVLPHVIANRLMKLRSEALIRAIGPPLFAAVLMGSVLTVFTWRRVEFLPWPPANLFSYMIIGASIYFLVIFITGIAFGQRKRMVEWLTGSDFSGQKTQTQAAQ